MPGTPGDAFLKTVGAPLPGLQRSGERPRPAGYPRRLAEDVRRCPARHPTPARSAGQQNALPEPG